MKHLLAAFLIALAGVPALAQVESNSTAGAAASVAPINFNPQYFSTTSPYSVGLQRIDGQPVHTAGTAIPTQGSPISCFKPGAAFGYQGDKLGITAALGSLFGLSDDLLCDIGRAKNIVVDIESIPADSDAGKRAKRLAKRIACNSPMIADAYEAEERAADRCEDFVRRADRPAAQARAPRAAQVASNDPSVWLP